MGRRLLWAVTAVGVCGLLLGGMYGWLSPAPLLTPDSLGYINWHPIRSPGYPAFLSLWPHPSGAFAGIGLVQGALLISATCFLAHSVGVVTRRTWPAVIFGIVVLALAPLWKWAMQVRPEILFIVLVEVFFGAAARTLVSRRASWAIIGGAAFAGAMLVRPVAIGFLPALLLLAWSVWRRKRELLAVLLLAGLPVVMQTAVVVTNGLHRGYYAPQAFTGLTLFGKTAPLVPAEGFGDERSIRLASQLAPLRDAVARVDNDTFYWVTRQGYDAALWDLFMKGIETTGSDVVMANEAAMRISLQAIRSDPPAYARLAFRHVVGMWSWPWISTQERMTPVLATLQRSDLRAFLARKAKASDLWLVPEAVYEAKLWAAAIVFALCFGACVAALLSFGRDPALSLAGAAGLGVIGYTLLVGSVQFADNRYAYAILPVVVLALSVFAATIADAVRASRRETTLRRMSSVTVAN